MSRLGRERRLERLPCSSPTCLSIRNRLVGAHACGSPTGAVRRSRGLVTYANLETRHASASGRSSADSLSVPCPCRPNHNRTNAALQLSPEVLVRADANERSTGPKSRTSFRSVSPILSDEPARGRWARDQRVPARGTETGTEQPTVTTRAIAASRPRNARAEPQQGSIEPLPPKALGPSDIRIAPATSARDATTCCGRRASP